MTASLTAASEIDTANRRILTAAIDCILERGFYRASSNEIARRAGMTWGAIQYHFGTREKLMLAALEVFNRDFEATLAAAHKDDAFGAGSTAERLERLATLLAHQYARPEYLATLQIILNLSHNPETSAETAAALEHFETTLSTQLRSLIARAIGPGADSAVDPQTVTFVFHALRGLAASHLINAETTARRVPAEQHALSLQQDAHRLAEALALFIESDSSIENDSSIERGSTNSFQ
jgi:AcrR family transcriptional regulator